VADDERPAVGTVAEEAARLLDALGGWATSAQAGYAAGSAHAAPTAGADGTAAEGAHAGDTGSTGPRCESCGAENGVGQAVTCQLCPVCQGIGLLRSVRPETVDRLADLAGALAATLRDIAGQRRAAGDATSPRGKPSPASRVQDIAVDDEDAPGSATS
jgi:hypothetical protein